MQQNVYDKMLYWYKLFNIKPRESQVKAAKLIAENWDKKYHIISAPTGVGKSLISLAVSFAAGNAYILTHTKQLQDQYINGPGDVVDLRGRGNYKCGINPTMTAADAPCVQFKHIIGQCAKRGICPYIQQKQKALAANNLSTNYAYFLYSRLCGPFQECDPRNVLIADEGHILENQLINFAEFELNPEEIKDEFGIYDMTWNFTGSEEENVEIVDSIAEEMNSEMNRLNCEVRKIYRRLGINEETATAKDIQDLPDKEKRKIKELLSQADKLDKILKKINIYLSTRKHTKWVIHSNDEKNSLIVTPLTSDSLFHPFCGGAANKFVFLSATIGDPEEFARELGLPLEDCNFVEVDSTFDANESPIIHISVGKFNYQEIDRTLPKALKVIDSLLNEHSGDKGIIHSTSYKITNFIAQNSFHRKRLLHKGVKKFGANNNELIKMHEDSKQSTVLLSPSMGTGISLDDELARFQIIIKLPFLSLGDPRVKRKMQISNSWYRNKMWQEVMQMSGRATRSDDDYCITYILDESMEYFYQMDRKRLPNWFKDRLIF